MANLFQNSNSYVNQLKVFFIRQASRLAYWQIPIEKISQTINKFITDSLRGKNPRAPQNIFKAPAVAGRAGMSNDMQDLGSYCLVFLLYKR